MPKPPPPPPITAESAIAGGVAHAQMIAAVAELARIGVPLALVLRNVQREYDRQGVITARIAAGFPWCDECKKDYADGDCGCDC